MVKVLFVCLGNICRSPLAEGIFAKFVADAGLQNEISCDSAGIGHWHEGEAADHRARKVGQEHQVEVTHRARQIRPKDLNEFQYIISMDTSVNQSVVKMHKSRPNASSKLLMMRDFDPKKDGPDVPDPYNSDEQAFKDVYAILDRSCRELLTNIREAHQI